MFIQLKDHKAHVFVKNNLDPSKENFIFIPGAVWIIELFQCLNLVH